MNISIIALLICILIMIFVFVKNKTIPEKIMSINCITNYIAVLLCMFSLFDGRESYIDISYILVLTGYVANLSYSKLKE